MKKDLEVKNLCKKFDGKDILKDVSFDVYDGEFLSILGASGCGKTTLLRILIGIEKADSGSIIRDGIDITNSHPSKRGMGIVFQNYALFPNMTVLENVEYALKINKEKRQQAKEIALSSINKVGLIEHKDKYPNQLSGGQQQRVAIARALANKPEIILADEPTGALDSKTGIEIKKLLKDLNKEGQTIILITHDNSMAEEAERIVRISDGKLYEKENG